MSSTTGSTAQSGSRVRRAAVVTHGKAETIGPALGRLEAIAAEHGVELVFPEEEREKHDLPGADGDPGSAAPAAALGGRRHEAAGADALPRHARAGDRRELRPRWLPRLDAPGRAGGRPRPRVRRG